MGAIESGKGKRNKHAVSLFGNNMGSDREPTIHKLDWETFKMAPEISGIQRVGK